MPTVMSSGPDSVGRPDVARELLGRLLRLLRESRNVSRADAGRFIGCSDPKISRIELADTTVKETDLERLLDLYEVTDTKQRQAILRLASLLNVRQWWHDYRDVLPGWLCSYLVLESLAEHIRTYETWFVPGLLQTPAYAEAVVRLRHHSEDEVHRRVEARMERRSRVLPRSKPKLWAVIDEAALTLEVAKPSVMREQIDFLIRVTARDRIPIQILPTGLAAASAGGMSFSMLRLPIDQLSDIVYLEQIDSAIFFDSAQESDAYRAVWHRLTHAARKPEKTMPFLQRARDALG
ncbi:DUF5753 domain-containing protein [Winogradskya humida]|uniref:Transcriptional regulator n=1 Tax=Winogradskya humida TaxID=113566 RepID=A0ABQ4A9B6_9ACTN|nr:DUF5753 domain-containing protein [Actinoplanes humidus]GIE26932.1 transcriptional regulator [Actinoplanes humidus]